MASHSFNHKSYEKVAQMTQPRSRRHKIVRCKTEAILVRSCQWKRQQTLTGFSLRCDQVTGHLCCLARSRVRVLPKNNFVRKWIFLLLSSQFFDSNILFKFLATRVFSLKGKIPYLFSINMWISMATEIVLFKTIFAVYYLFYNWGKLTEKEKTTFEE